MSLPVDLVSQFVKATKDVQRTKKESIVYGTVKESNGSFYVTIDGSTVLTPVDSTTSIKDGERVTVMIKNHTATITGNITSPSANQSEIRSIDDKVNEVANKVDGVASPEEFKKLSDTVKNMETDFSGITTSIENIEKSKLDVSLDNLDETTLNILFTKSGLVEDASIKDGVITGKLKGVTIGGFNIGTDILFAGAKETVTSNELGIFLGADGQFCIGDSTNFIRYSKDADTNYSLDICAEQYNFSKSQAGPIKALPDGGFEFSLTKDGTKIIFDIDEKIYKVAADGTKTVLAG